MFGVATVMNVCLFKLSENVKYGLNTLDTKTDFVHIGNIKNPNRFVYLDTLKISNIQESGPKKTFKAGAKNIPIVKYGKTVKIDIEDALGRLDTLVNFFNLHFDDDFNIIYSDNNFSEPFALHGEMQVVDMSGQKHTLFIFIPCFVPQNNLTINQDAEGEFGIFDLSGDIFSMPIQITKYYEEGTATAPDSKTFCCNYVISNEPIVTAEEQHSIKMPIYNKDYIVLSASDDFNGTLDNSVTKIYEEDDVLFISSLA